ncbi:hypothetical protein LR48_Vigan728s003900 [Vigna angularis]|uniref:DUF4408 domain-containing protein n=2 Tax=Phaseolus angularis TaxID=3914 RepID=A0A0L9TGK1_PHAAN|nr:pathogen-associated molecular patterns-induced protein A70 [Vigna angularis]KAG2407519.1 uncharacterized protein HKW66_Vig0023410 [Vigna angularis]KOM29616.1 hypothetical protein LR48_Vigan728s003900 [Vigna angularis]BAT76818.1 hypothetical protein VIGAN_01487600 [Vigna angularis var. angularis]
MADPASFIASWLTPSSLFIFVNLVIGTIAITSRFTPKNHHHHHPHLAPSPSLLQRVSSFNLTHYYTHHHHPDPDFTHPQLVPTPSLLQRVKSFNLSFRKHEPTHAETHHLQPQHAQSTNPELVRTPSLLDRLTSFDLSLKNQEPTNAQTQHAQPEPEPEQPELVRSPSLLQRLQSINLSRLYRSEPVHGEDPSGGSGKAEMRKSASERRGSIEREEEEEVERRRPQTARVEATSCREDEEVDAKADDFINRFKKQLRLQRIDSLLRYRAGSG